MKSLVVQPFVAAAFLSAVFLTAAIAETPAVPKPASVASYGQLPLGFEVNQGQADPSIEFVTHGPGYTLLLKRNEAVFAFHKFRADKTNVGTEPKSSLRVDSSSTPEVLRLNIQLIGAHGHSLATREGLQITSTNYFLGNDPAHWRTDIASYDKVRYRSIYDGIDLVYYGNQGQLEHDFVVAPGADPARITLAFNFASPDQEKLRLDSASGNLLISANAELRLLKPVTYQESNGKRVTIPSSYILLAGNRIRFAIGPYNHTQPLIIDPVLVYSTYLGGSGAIINGDRANGIAVDRAGHTYLVGTTYSTDFPITDRAVQSQNLSTPASQGPTVFVSKLNRTGTALIYSTYLGGSGGDFGYGIALDAEDNAFVTGATYSTDFPVTSGAFQTTRSSTTPGAPTGFVARLSATGHRLRYSTYLGGTGQPASGKGDVAQAIAVNHAGDAYVTGYTYSPDFPVTDEAFQTSFAGGPYVSNGFVTKLNAAGTELRYSTYLGGSGSFGGEGDYANAIAINDFGDAFITGLTSSADFPVTKGAFQTTYAGAFVTKLDRKGASEVYSTFLGGNNTSSGQAIAVDHRGFAYVAGNTYSTDFPVTSGVLQPSSLGMGFPLGFVSKLNMDGTDLVYSTYLEGQQTSIMGLAVDRSGTAYVAGTAPPLNSGLYGDFQVTPDALSLPADSTAAFLVKLDRAASALNYATLIGGSLSDGATSIALDAAGDAYLTGYSNSADFPVSAQAFQGVNHNVVGGNAFVAKFSLANELNQTAYPANVGPIPTTLGVFVGIQNVQCNSLPGGGSTYDTCFGWTLGANAAGPDMGGIVNFSALSATGGYVSFATPGPFPGYPSVSGQSYCYNLNLAPPSGGPINVSVSGNYTGDGVYQSSSANGSASNPGCPPNPGMSGVASQTIPQRSLGSDSKFDVSHRIVLPSNKALKQEIGPKFLPSPARVR